MNSKQLRAQLDAIQRSTSWRVTAPLRAIGRMVKFKRPSGFSMKRIIVGILRRMVSQPRLRHAGMMFFSRFPKTQRRIKQLLLSSRSSQFHDDGSSMDWNQGNSQLSPTAQTILRRLRIMIDSND